MKEQLIEAWRTNNKVNLLFIDNVSDKGMQKTLSSRGGKPFTSRFMCKMCVCSGWK